MFAIAPNYCRCAKPARAGNLIVATMLYVKWRFQMITTLVQFQMSTPITIEDATRRFESSAPKYQNLPGLIRKYYIRSEDGRAAGGIYLWGSRQAAEKDYSGEWRARVEKLYGGKPVITWFDSPVIVDNFMGGKIITDVSVLPSW